MTVAKGGTVTLVGSTGCAATLGTGAFIGSVDNAGVIRTAPVSNDQESFFVAANTLVNAGTVTSTQTIDVGALDNVGVITSGPAFYGYSVNPGPQGGKGSFLNDVGGTTDLPVVTNSNETFMQGQGTSPHPRVVG